MINSRNLIYTNILDLTLLIVSKFFVNRSGQGHFLQPADFKIWAINCPSKPSPIINAFW